MRNVTLMMSIVALLALLPASTRAQAPPLLPVQGVLYDANRAPMTGTVSLTFAIYADEARSAELHSETQRVTLTNGFFSLFLGSDMSLDLATFAGSATTYLGVRVEDDPEMALIELGTTAYAAYSEHAGNAATVDGRDADALRTFDSCPGGSAVRIINSDGTVTCEDVSALTNASTLDTGTLSTDRFSAYADLTAESHLDGADDADLLTRVQADGRYVRQGQADAIASGMIADGQVASADIANNAIQSQHISQNAVTHLEIATNAVRDDEIDDALTDCDASDDLCRRSVLDGRFVNAGEGDSVTGSMITDGQVFRLDVAANYRDCSGTNDLCERGDLDGRFVNEGEANSIDSAMITNGQVTSADVADGSLQQQDFATPNPADLNTTCGRFIPVVICPFGNHGGGFSVDCNEVGVGQFCEADDAANCRRLGDNVLVMHDNINNCGAAEWFYRIQ